jgi:hypothetical protein
MLKHDACDQQVTFCWYGPNDKVEAWGENCAVQDSSEKPLSVLTAIKCVKRLHVCQSQPPTPIGGKTMTWIDILLVSVAMPFILTLHSSPCHRTHRDVGEKNKLGGPPRRPSLL